MPWTRTGDNAATYPALMQLQGAPGADERTVNEVFGFLMRCAFQSAAHMTDYVLDAGTAYMVGGARTTELIKLCVRAAVLTPIKQNRLKAWRLIADPEFIHIRLRAEIEWERQQRKDTANPALTVPVRRRDGDNCRWCGVLVQWRGQRSTRTGTLDHQFPGKPGTPDTMFVACLGCNSGRKDNTDLWADNHTMRPEPQTPNYGKWTAKLLTDNGYPTAPNIHSDDAPALAAAADPAPSRPAAPSTTATALAAAPASLASAVSDPQRPETWKPPVLGVASGLVAESTPEVDETGLPGSGRAGMDTSSGTSPGPAVPPAPSSTSRPKRRRGTRGGRSRPRTSDQEES